VSDALPHLSIDRSAQKTVVAKRQQPHRKGSLILATAGAAATQKNETGSKLRREGRGRGREGEGEGKSLPDA